METHMGTYYVLGCYGKFWPKGCLQAWQSHYSWLSRLPTVTTYNACNTYLGSPGIIHDRTPRLPLSFLGNGCMDNLTTDRSFYLQATWIIDVLSFFLTCYPWVFVHPGIGKRPVDWCKNYMPIPYARFMASPPPRAICKHGKGITYSGDGSPACGRVLCPVSPRI